MSWLQRKTAATISEIENFPTNLRRLGGAYAYVYPGEDPVEYRRKVRKVITTYLLYPYRYEAQLVRYQLHALNTLFIEPMLAPHYQAYDYLLAPIVDRVIIIYQSIGPLRLPTWDDYEYIKAEVIRLTKLIAQFIVAELPALLWAGYLTAIDLTVQSWRWLRR